MSPRPIFCIVGLVTTTAVGQLRVISLPPPGAGPDWSVARDESRGAQPLYQRPGVYILPSPDAQYFDSPHRRPYPDYSTWREAHPRRFETRHFGAVRPDGWPPPLCIPGAPDALVRDAYHQGRYDADREYLAYMASQRAGRLMNQYSIQFDEGVCMFRDGHFEHALINLLGAAEKNHDSAAPRLHAGHALFALGRYRQAAPLLERAFELAPSLATRTYNIREEYGQPEVFDTHRARLTEYVRRHPMDAAAWTLHGYVTYYTEGPSAAEPILRHAARLNPQNTMIPKLRAISSLLAPPEDRGASRAEPAMLVLRSAGRDTIPSWKTPSPVQRKVIAKSSSR